MNGLFKMAYWTHTKDPIGCFVEKEIGNYFEYSINDEPTISHLGEDFPHKVWVGDVVGQGFRYANVKKTVAYVCIDQDEFGLPVIERWFIHNHREYAN